METEQLEEQKRGVLLTIISIFLGLGCLLSLFTAFTPIAAKLGIYYQVVLVIAALVTGISAVGIWSNKKWGAFTYIGLSVFNQPFLYIMGWWNLGALLVPGVICVLLGFKLKQMK